jgi:hypothetical protein
MRAITTMDMGLRLMMSAVMLVGLGRGIQAASALDSSEAKAVRARAILQGPGGIEGVVTFRQPPCPGCPTPAAVAEAQAFQHFPEPTVKVVARVHGPVNVLQPGPHGFHIHENGICEAA